MSQDKKKFMGTTKLTANQASCEYMKLCNTCDSEGSYTTKLRAKHPCIALVSGAAVCAWFTLDIFHTSQSAVTAQSADPQLQILHVATFQPASTLIQSVASQQLTSCTSSCFNVINVPPSYITSKIMWLSEVCKLPGRLDTFVPQCRCILSIISIKLAQEGLKLCPLAKRSMLTTLQISLDSSARGGARSVGMHNQRYNDKRQNVNPWDRINIVGCAVSGNEVQVQHSWPK